MCNPRRVTIQLSRTVSESWRTTVEQAARAEGQVQELARVRTEIPLDADLGDRALATLERLLRGEFEEFEAWQRDAEGRYRRDLGEVTLVYEPGSHQLMVEAQLVERLTAEARATAEASGFTVGEVAAEAMGRYYDDGWGGRTEERARRQAQEEAEQRLREATEALHRREHATELGAAEEEARARAAAAAAARLAEVRDATRAALRQRLQVILDEAQERVRHTLNRLVGEAYRRTLIELVRDNGGRVLSDQRSGSVIHLELEVP